MLRLEFIAIGRGCIAMLLSIVPLFAFVTTMGIMGMLDRGFTWSEPVVQLMHGGFTAPLALMTLLGLLVLLLQLIPGMVVANQAPAGAEYHNAAAVAFITAFSTILVCRTEWGINTLLMFLILMSLPDSSPLPWRVPLPATMAEERSYTGRTLNASNSDVYLPPNPDR